MTSPRLTPAFSAGLSSETALTSAPFTSDSPRLPARSELIALHRHAQHAAVDGAAADELVHDVLRHVGGDGEADPDVAARGREDLRVDADQLAARVDERAAGVALVDGRVGLEEVLEAAVADARRASLGADDAHGDGLADAERVADGERDVADAHAVGVAERQGLAAPSRRP